MTNDNSSSYFSDCLFLDFDVWKLANTCAVGCYRCGDEGKGRKGISLREFLRVEVDGFT